MNELKSNSEFFDLVVNSLENIIFIVDRDTNIIEHNNSLAAAFSMDEEKHRERRCGNFLGCSFVTEEGGICGSTNFCEGCPIRLSFNQVFKKGAAIRQYPLAKDFYVDGRRVKKHFLMSAKPTTYKDDQVALVVLNDVTELAESKLKLEEMLVTDYLTGVYNRRYLFSELEKLITSAERYDLKLSVLMVDIDNFKGINDTYGHLTGDKVLAGVASLLSETLRKSDILGRYGGEEFMIILPHTDIHSAYKCAERIRQGIEAGDLGLPVKLTVSSGAASFTEGMKAEELISTADSLLYKAKANGRNRTEI